MVISRVVFCMMTIVVGNCLIAAQIDGNNTGNELHMVVNNKELISSPTDTNVSVAPVTVPTARSAMAIVDQAAVNPQVNLPVDNVVEEKVGSGATSIFATPQEQEASSQKSSDVPELSIVPSAQEASVVVHTDDNLPPASLEPIAVAPLITVSADEQQPDVEVVGIDTVDLKDPQGNWLFKRIWWERAEAKYEKIRMRVAAVFEARMLFFAKRSEFDKKIIDPFFISIGISSGQLEQLMNAMIERIEKERATEGSLNEQERELLANLQHDYDLVEQIKADILQVELVSKGVDDALDKLIEQLNRVRSYEQEAWHLFKEVARVLSDKKAREIFYQMDAISKNISNVAVYVQQQFEPHFNNLIATGQKQVERLTLTIKELQEKGVDFKERYEQLEKLHHESIKKVNGENKEQEEPEQEHGITSTYIINPIVNVFNYVVSGVIHSYNWVMSFFVSNKIEEPTEE